MTLISDDVVPSSMIKLLHTLDSDIFLPLLWPFWSLNIVQSSMEPNGANIILTSLSEHFLEIIPTNNFLSSINKIWEKTWLVEMTGITPEVKCYSTDLWPRRSDDVQSCKVCHSHTLTRISSIRFYDIYSLGSESCM